MEESIEELRRQNCLDTGMRVVIVGATGFIGRGVLKECIESPLVEEIVTVNRSPVEEEHPKIVEKILLKDFEHFYKLFHLKGIDACYFCAGVRYPGVPILDYKYYTYHNTLNVAKGLYLHNQELTFCFISHERADESQEIGIIWERFLGRTENAVLLFYEHAYIFRLGFILPARGIMPKTRKRRRKKRMLKFFYPLFRRSFEKFYTTTENIGKAMIQATIDGHERQRLHSNDVDTMANDYRKRIHRYHQNSDAYRDEDGIIHPKYWDGSPVPEKELKPVR